jgi:hypothetical protein
MMNLVKQEELVLQYQATGEDYYLTVLGEAYRSRIQGKAYDISLRYKNLNDQDIESSLLETLCEAAKDWIQSLNVPFDKFVSMRFKQCLVHIYSERKKKKDSSIEMVYYMAYGTVEDGGQDSEGYDLVDPRENVENFIAEEDAVKSLYEYLKSKKPTAAEVAVLRAAGYELAEIAEVMNYVPDSKNYKVAQKDWSKRRLANCQEPAKDYYFLILKADALPIKLKA